MDQKTIVVGLTGGIGTGKSMVCKIFKAFNIPVLDSDALAKDLITNNKEISDQIIETFGDDSYLPDGTYNTRYISQRVFNNEDLLKKLNAIVHPAVISHSQAWVKEHSNSKYVVKEAALMIESGSYKLNNYNILVVSPLDLRVERIRSRDHSDPIDIQKKINSQLSDEERLKYIDYCIYNDEQHSLIEQVQKIHTTMLAL